MNWWTTCNICYVLWFALLNGLNDGTKSPDLIEDILSTWQALDVGLGYRIKQDDRTIQNEGLDTLSEPELQAAFREWGMLGLRSVEEMQQLTLLPVHLLLILSFYLWGLFFSAPDCGLCYISHYFLDGHVFNFIHWAHCCLMYRYSCWSGYNFAAAGLVGFVSKPIHSFLPPNYAVKVLNNISCMVHEL